MTLFSRNRRYESYHTDVHSHLLPGIDDGVDSWEESLEILSTLETLGFRAVVTTPHILADFYPNSPETILPLRDELRIKASEAGINLRIDAAAEYYVDETFLELLDSGQELLHFGRKKYVLFETGFLNEPRFLKQVIFQLKSMGYQPLMAHPERYVYFQQQPKLVAEYAELTLFQVNTLSLMGYYQSAAKSLAQQMHKANLIAFLGSDLHRPKQLSAFEEAVHTKLYRQIMKEGLENLSFA